MCPSPLRHHVLNTKLGLGFWASNSRWHAAMLFLLFEFSESLAWSSLALVARYTRGLAMQNKMSLASHARICVCLMLFGVCSNYILSNVLVQSFLHRWYSLWFFERTWITCLGKKALVNLIDVCVYTNCLISPQPLSAFSQCRCVSSVPFPAAIPYQPVSVGDRWGFWAHQFTTACAELFLSVRILRVSCVK